MSDSSFVLIDQKSHAGARRGTVAIALLALLLTGCADDRVAGPDFESTPWNHVPMGRAPVGVPSPDVIIHHVADDSASAEFTVTPTGGVFHLGPHAIYFPANAICDPATSTYGPGEWDAPCDVLTTPIRFRAEVRELDGRSYVDFTPAVRFVPTNDDANAVWLYMKTASLSTDSDSALKMLSRMTVLYSHAIGELGVNEAATDASLRTYVWLEGGIAFRRIKHFSGYNVYSGYTVRGGEMDAGEEGDIEMVGSMIISVAY